MSNNPKAQYASTPIMAATTTTKPGLASNNQSQFPIRAGGGIAANTQLQFQQQQQQQQQSRVVSPVVSPVPPRQEIAMVPTKPNHPLYTNSNNLSPPPQYYAVPAAAPNVNHQHPAAQVHNGTMAWQQQHSQLLLQQQHQQQQQQQQQQYLNYPRQHVPLQTTTRPSRDENDNSDDVSSIPFGSIRPDPRYDPSKDPLHPANINKPFVPPEEITITIVRQRRRKTMDNHSSLQPQSCVVREEEQYQQHTTQVPVADWLQVPPLAATLTGSSSTPPPALGHTNSMDVSNTNPVSDNNSHDVDNSDSDSQEQFSDIASYIAVDGGNYFLALDEGAEEYLDLRGDLLELQKLQLLQNPPYYDGIQVKPGGEEPDEHTNVNNNNISMEVTVDNPPPPPQQRKGMVRREFSRRVFNFKKKKANNSMIQNNNNENSIDDGENNEVIIDVSGTDVGVDVDVDEVLGKPSKKKMGKPMYYSAFGTHYYNKSKMMTLVSDQENGC